MVVETPALSLTAAPTVSGSACSLKAPFNSEYIYIESIVEVLYLFSWSA